AEDLLFGRNQLLAEALDRSALERLWREHSSASRDHSVFLWGLMMFGLWEKTSKVPHSRPD
ncbi:MAG: hypothetical protein ACREU6_18205, partial [Steroidobacteraceae bacterium]